MKTPSLHHSLFLVLLFCGSLALAANRPISKKWDVRNGPNRRMAIQWFAGESVAFDLHPVVGRNAFDLEGQTLLFEVIDWSGTNAFLSVTGTVSGTTARWVLSPEQGNLPAGTYNAYAMATTTNSQTVLAWMTAVVKWSPASDDYDLIEPWSLIYHTDIPGAIASNTTGIDALDTELSLKIDAATAATDAELLSTSNTLATATLLKIPSTEINQPNGVVGLDENGFIDPSAYANINVIFSGAQASE